MSFLPSFYPKEHNMSYAESILPEFDQEMANTRKVLECLPDDKLDWKPHPKMNTIGWNANHIAEMVGWVEGMIAHLTWDIAPAEGEQYQSPKLTTRQEVLDLFDQNVTAARKAISDVSDEEISKVWSLLKAGEPMITMPRIAAIRSFVFNHIIHHRAHLCVYLRLNDISVPGMYGPSGE